MIDEKKMKKKSEIFTIKVGPPAAAAAAAAAADQILIVPYGDQDWKNFFSS